MDCGVSARTGRGTTAKEENLWGQADGTKMWLRWSVSPWRNEEGTVGGIIIITEDITQRRQAEERLRLADAVFRSTQEGIVVTDLERIILAANPARLDARFAHAVETSRRAVSLCVLTFIDLDGFKAVNDTVGHQAVDELLQLADKRMGERLREADTLARGGGDESALVLGGLSEPSDATRITQLIIDQLRAPFKLANGNEVSIGGSAGISLFPSDGKDAEALMMGADAALYAAKAAGRGTWRLASV